MSERYELVAEDSLKRTKCVVLTGPPGCGKTFLIHKVANKMKYKVVEYDANEIDEKLLKKLCTTYMLEKTVIVVDIIDQLSYSEQNKLFRASSKCVNPVIFTAYNVLTLSDESKNCQLIMLSRPDIRDLSVLVNELSRKYNLKPNYKALNSRDYRQAILSLYGSEGYDIEETKTKIVEKFFRTGVLENVDPNILITIIDNVSNFYGYYAYLLLKLASISDLTKRSEPLEIFELKGVISKPKPSYFLEKVKLAKGFGML